MGRDLTPKYKRSRREGIELHPDLDKTGTAKSPFTRKQYQPGMHGPHVMRSRITNYGTQLREKQKVKRIYGILERQFSNYFRKAIASQGDTGDVMLSFLEQRLDNVVYRLGFAKTRPAARQMVSHAHIFVNGKKNTIPSANLSVGDIITIKPSIVSKPSFMENLKAIDRTVVSWLARNNTEGKIVAEPDIEDLKSLIEVRKIVEFYSR